MSQRKEKVRDGLEIDFDLLDSDLLRCYVQNWLQWHDGPQPRIAWLDFVDRGAWTEGKPLERRVMWRTLDNEAELREGLRFLRLQRYASYLDLDDLAGRQPEPGEFVIRKPPNLHGPKYLMQVEEDTLTDDLCDADLPEAEAPSPGVYWTVHLAEALRFTHAEAIRLTVRIMRSLGYDLPGEHGDYWEPVRLDVAEELHRRAKVRPRLPAAFSAMVWNLDREPQE